jgi:hypothetical protein
MLSQSNQFTGTPTPMAEYNCLQVASYAYNNFSYILGGSHLTNMDFDQNP